MTRAAEASPTAVRAGAVAAMAMAAAATALDPLADFIEDNLAGEVALQAANAATDAVFAILETAERAATACATRTPPTTTART